MIRRRLQHQSPNSSTLHPRLPSNSSPLDPVVLSPRLHPVALAVPASPVSLAGQQGQRDLANPSHLVALLVLPVLVSPPLRCRLCQPLALVRQLDLAPHPDPADRLKLLSA